MPSPAATFIPLDGRITSLQVLDLALTGGEVIEIVSPGNAEAGNNYQVTLTSLALFFASIPFTTAVTILDGATLADPYDVLITNNRILFNKTIGAPSYTVLPASETMLYPFPLLFKDLKGDADVNPITISFSGGQLCDGLDHLTIENPYGWFTVNPIPGGGGWFQTA